jgi:N-glycosylase/DNA lyase
MTYNTTRIDFLKSEYKKKKNEIIKRLSEFKTVSSGEYFYELMYCLFTPQSSAQNCFKAVAEIKSMDYLIKSFPLKNILHQKDGTYIRFHNNKERYVKEAKLKLNMILENIEVIKEPFPLREWLVNNIKGLSYKESTHFLRNIGKNGDLAILDRHILNNLLDAGAITEIPKSLSKNKYYEIEKIFQNFAFDMKIDINELDLLFWSFGTGIILK